MVNADSMQLYRGMDVGTAKLTEAEQGGVVHHVLDVWDVTRRGQRRRLPADGPGRVRRRSARAEPVPVLVGGSGLYVRAALDRLEFPGTDPQVRRPAGGRARRRRPRRPAPRGWPRSTPRRPRAILPSNGRRLVRALEVVELTGRPFTASLPEPALRGAARCRSGSACRGRRSTSGSRRGSTGCGQRGLVEEVRRLADAGLREGRTASRALGYAQVLRHLAGEWTEEQARDETVRATRRFARRQESWFRRDPRVVWLDAADPDLVDRRSPRSPGCPN